MTDHPTRGDTVLLLEDEALIAVALQDSLEEEGYSVAGPFVTCADALAWLAGQRPDLAILDTVLKDGPCKEVALMLIEARVPLVVYSGHSSDRNTLPELAGATWVEKPAPVEVILQSLMAMKAKGTAPL